MYNSLYYIFTKDYNDDYSNNNNYNSNSNYNDNSYVAKSY